MYRAIVVPLDGSPLAERALPFATRLASACGAIVTLVRSIHDRQVSLLEPWAAEAVVREQLSAPERAERELLAAASRLRQEGVAVASHLSYEAPAQAILGAAAQARADLIVMSTHGRSGLGRWLYGSVADEVLRHSPVPVLLVPAAAEAAWPTDRPARVLATLDGSRLARAVLEPAARLAATLRAELLLLRVVEPPQYTSLYGLPPLEYDLEADLERARRDLERSAEQVRGRGLAVRVLADSGRPGPTIAAVAHEQGVDTIAMATHGRGGLTRLLMGSVASEVLHRARVPLLLVRPEAARQRAAEPVPQAEAAAPAAEAGPTASMSLNREELSLLERGLKELIYAEGRDWRLARPARALLERLEAAEASLAAEAASE